MISHQHRIIYIHIPKCAGRSICHAFNESFDHYTASYYQNEHPEQWHQYTVFTTVRNPYQRMVSMYHYIKKEPFHAGHAITNRGNMLPFKPWLMQNIAAFQGELKHPSTEGSRERDGEVGSTFWFSSQVSRISAASQDICRNIHILRYEDGMQEVSRFLHNKHGLRLSIPHLNSSLSDSRDRYLAYYDAELLHSINSFPPFAKDCQLLGYDMLSALPREYSTKNIG